MALTEAAAKRAGLILRVLPHGTVIVWDCDGARAYPYYRAGTEKFSLNESVTFCTDDTDTLVVAVDRASPPRKGVHRVMHDTEAPRRGRTAA
jgi:hypothetical protein